MRNHEKPREAEKPIPEPSSCTLKDCVLPWFILYVLYILLGFWWYLEGLGIQVTWVLAMSSCVSVSQFGSHIFRLEMPQCLCMSIFRSLLLTQSAYLT